MGTLYNQLLADVSGLILPTEKTNYAENIYWVYGVVLKEEINFNAAEAMYRLRKKGIGTRPFFWCLHEQPVFRKAGLFEGESYPVSERLARYGFYLPSGLSLTENEIRRVVAAVKNILIN